MTRFSTVIPTIGRSTLTQSVASALAQEVQEHEILVVNDRGGPIEREDWMGSPRVRVIETHREGVCVACNAGASQAEGRYVNFLHDDDFLLPGGLQALAEAAEAGESRWAVGFARLVDDQGREVGVSQPRLCGNAFAAPVMGETPHMSQCLLLRESFSEVGGFDPAIKISEDRDLVWRMALKWDSAFTDVEVSCLRVSGGQKSAFDFSTAARYSRLIRERILSAPGSLERVRDSAGQDPAVVGRVCRQYVLSCLLNLKAGQCRLALGRARGAVRLAGGRVLSPGFWAGVRHRMGSGMP